MIKRKYSSVLENPIFEECLIQFVRSDVKIISNGDSILFQNIIDIGFDTKYNEIQFIIQLNMKN